MSVECSQCWDRCFLRFGSPVASEGAALFAGIVDFGPSGSAPSGESFPSLVSAALLAASFSAVSAFALTSLALLAAASFSAVFAFKSSSF